MAVAGRRRGDGAAIGARDGKRMGWKADGMDVLGQMEAQQAGTRMQAGGQGCRWIDSGKLSADG